MKNLICLIVFSFVMLFSCSKDSLNDENHDLKRAKVPIPMKAEFCLTPNMNIPPVHVMGTPVGQIPSIDLPGGGWISGHATHMGEVIMEQSPSKTVSLSLNMGLLMQGKLVVNGIYEGKITADNGDYYLFQCTMNIFMADMSFTGNVHMYGGNGKFEGMTGDVVMNGVMPCWTGIGTMVYE